ncbi:MAG: ergothioneine biosynthesis glutamate--cysteine ligase EgtA [Micromonosporaceae bacterium]
MTVARRSAEPSESEPSESELSESERSLRTPADVEAYVARICFKTGPPELVGVELEWTVHHACDPTLPLDPAALRNALGPHSPPTLDPASPHQPLSSGSTITVEPGGQVEISTPPYRSLSALHAATRADLSHLTDLLARAGLVLGGRGIDPHRSPRRLLRTLRYDAMEAAFDRRGPEGRTMMCTTAGLQVCLDIGEPDRLAARWSALHALGPVLLAGFANSHRHAGRRTGWESARMAAWFGIDPARTVPVHTGADAVTAWARYALAAPLLCLAHRPDSWHAPPGVTFGDWLAGAMGPPPTEADLRLHLSTLFPPVRPRGYFEVRYIDAQPPGEWLAPVAVLTALLGDDDTVDRVVDLCAPVAGRWHTATRDGLANPAIRAAARRVLDLACRRLDHTDLTATDAAHVTEIVSRRLARTCQEDW